MKLNIDYRGETHYCYFKNTSSLNSVLEFKHNWMNEITILLR